MCGLFEIVCDNELLALTIRYRLMLYTQLRVLAELRELDDVARLGVDAVLAHILVQVVTAEA